MLKDDIAAMSRAGQIKTESFVYNALFPVLPGPGQLAVNVNITNDSDFAICATNLISYSAVGVIVVLPDYYIQLLDTSSGRILLDQPSHVGNITGTGQLPYFWPEPYLLKGGGTLTVTLINPTALAALVNVSFIGYKVFYLSDFRR